MRIIRVQYRGQIFYATLGEGEIICLNRQLNFEAPIPLAQVGLMPLVTPSKVVCVGLNYRDHAAEMGQAIPERLSFFLRPPSSLLNNGQPVQRPFGAHVVHHEAELAFVVGQACRRIRPEDAPRHIFGYTCANDFSVRDYPDDPFHSAGKSFDATCPVGPWLETSVSDLDELPLRCVVNGEVRQSGSTADMIFSPHEILSHLSQIMTLNPGDVVLTGTPSGTGPIHANDTVQVEIPGVGVLFNSIAEDLGAEPLPVQ